MKTTTTERVENIKRAEGKKKRNRCAKHRPLNWLSFRWKFAFRSLVFFFRLLCLRLIPFCRLGFLSLPLTHFTQLTPQLALFIIQRKKNFFNKCSANLYDGKK